MPAEGKQFATYTSKRLLEIPCMEFHVTQTLATFFHLTRQTDRNKPGSDGDINFHVRVRIAN